MNARTGFLRPESDYILPGHVIFPCLVPKDAHITTQIR